MILPKEKILFPTVKDDLIKRYILVYMFLDAITLENGNSTGNSILMAQNR